MTSSRLVLILDLDDTLYSINSGIRDACLKRIAMFVTDILHIETDDPIAFCYSLYYKHGSTYLGLRRTGHDVNAIDFYQYVNDTDPATDSNITPNDQRLQTLLSDFRSELSFDKIFLLTNAERKHAHKMLTFLNIARFFDAQCCMEDFAEHKVAPLMPKPSTYGLVNKPNPESFEIASSLFGLLETDSVVYVEDSARNLQGARSAGSGWRCFLVDERGRFSGEGDPLVEGVEVVETLYDVYDVLAGEGEEEQGGDV